MEGYIIYAARSTHRLASADISGGDIILSDRSDIRKAIQLTDNYVNYYKYDEEENDRKIGSPTRYPTDIWRCSHDGSGAEFVLAEEEYVKSFILKYIDGGFAYGETCDERKNGIPLVSRPAIMRLADRSVYKPDTRYIY